MAKKEKKKPNNNDNNTIWHFKRANLSWPMNQSGPIVRIRQIAYFKSVYIYE